MYKILTRIIVFMFAKTVFSQTDSTLYLDLKQAQNLAIENNINVKNARIDAVISKKKVWETTAMGLPQVSGSIAHNYNIDLPVTLIPAQMFNAQAPEGTYMEMSFGTDHSTNAGITATQLIFSGEYIVGLRASKIYQQLSVQNLEKSEIDIREQVANTYNLILFALSNKDIIDSNIVFTKSLLNETEQMFKQGFTESISVDQLKLNLTSLENSAASINRQIEITKNLLKFQLGVDLTTEINLSQNSSSILIANDYSTQSNTFNPENQIEFKLVSTQENLQLLSLQREKSTFLPQVSAFYNHQQSMMSNDFDVFTGNSDWYNSNIVGLNINIPIFSSGLRYSKVSQASLELEKAKNSKEMLTNSLKISAIQSQLEYNNNYETYVREKQNIELSEKIYNQNTIKYKNGTISSLEFTQAQMQNISAKQALNKTIFDLINSKIKLDRIYNN